ncbi:hypothetical protein PVAP13_9KG103020 [Panicum virgatum]|uniref:Uncharacterized protein n=1 Tax=Panicum virgatum TaxID=38727 RepID=A0A8T0NK25_PANVG|nr:hypothetical protein PVAP13_9KG103020 [Panicum virgatum]
MKEAQRSPQICRTALLVAQAQRFFRTPSSALHRRSHRAVAVDCSTEPERAAFPHVPAAAASQVGAEKGDYLGLVQLIGRPAAARPALPLRPCIGDAHDYFSRILLVGILTGVPTSDDSRLQEWKRQLIHQACVDRRKCSDSSTEE